MQPPPLVRLMSNSSLLGAPGTLQSPSPTGQALNTQQNETSSHVSSHHPASENRNDRTDKSVAKAAKSFKVTLDDPTFKVLPAALKSISAERTGGNMLCLSALEMVSLNWKHD
jgi:hypothetical protein